MNFDLYSPARMPSRQPHAAGLIGAAVILAAVYVAGSGFERLTRLVAPLRDPKAVNCDIFQNWAAVVDHAHGRGIYYPLTQGFDLYADRLGPAYRPDEPSPYTGLTGPGPDNVVLVNAHPPFATFLTTPLAGLTFHDAYRVFAGFNLALLAAAGVLMVTAGGPNRPGRAARVWLAVPLAAFAASSSPVILQTAYGNWNAVLLLLFVVAWRLATGGRPGCAGALVGVAALIKLYPALLAVFFLLPGRRRGLVGFAAAVAAGTALTLAVYGVQTHADYVRKVIPVIRHQTTVLNVSLPAAAGRLFDPGQPTVVPLVRSRVLMLAYLGCWALAVAVPVAWAVLFRGRRANPDGVFAALVAALVLLSPVSYSYNQTQLILPAWVVASDAVRRRLKWTPVLLAAALAVIWFDPGAVHAALLPGGPPYQPWAAATVLTVHTYAILVLYGLACSVALRGRDEESPPPAAAPALT